MCLNSVTRLQENLLPDYHSIKRHSDFEEQLVPYCDHNYYYWNAHTYTYLGHSLLVALNNDTYLKSSIALQAYKVFNTHDHEISGWTIISILLHAHIPHLGGMNGDVQSDLSNLSLNNG